MSGILVIMEHNPKYLVSKTALIINKKNNALFIFSGSYPSKMLLLHGTRCVCKEKLHQFLMVVNSASTLQQVEVRITNVINPKKDFREISTEKYIQTMILSESEEHITLFFNME